MLSDIRKYISLLAVLTLFSQFLISVSYNREDSRFIQLAQECGYNATEKDVVTDDGYILRMFHIPGDKNKTVLLSHGILDSAETFLVRRNLSLVSALVGLSYDVWLLNNRGNPHSRRHVLFDSDKSKAFWNFSFHELAVYDLPACIDYILDENKVKRISLIGHSLGNLQYYVMGAMRPEYNDKVNVAIALGPVAFLNIDNLAIPISTIAKAYQILNVWLKSTNQEEIFGKSSILLNFLLFLCSEKWWGYEFCMRTLVSPISGGDSDEFEPAMLHEVLKHFPCSTSRKTVLHLSQTSLSRKFMQFDYGEKNLQIYRSPSPPEYNLNKTTMKIALLVGANDKLANEKNSIILRDKLPNVVSYQVLELNSYSHLEFVWGKHMNKYLFPHIVRILKKYT